MPAISIITPVYNAEAYLEQCLKSVLGQTFTDFEFLCIDDGSTDASLSLLRAYAASDARIIVETQKNAGAAAARNRALKQARGTYLAFIDADDFVKPQWLEKLHGSAVDADADIVIHPLATYDMKTETHHSLPWSCMSENFPPVFSWRDNPDKIFSSFHNWACNKFFRTALIQENNLSFQRVAHTEDLLFTCSALIFAHRITTIDDALYSYRVGNPASNLSTNDRAPLDFFKAHTALKEFLEKEGIYDLVGKSYRDWTADGLSYQLSTYKNPDTYRRVFEFAQTQGLRDLDLKDQPAASFANPQHYQLIESISKDSLEENLFFQYKRALASVSEREQTIDALVDEIQAYEQSPTWKLGNFLLAIPKGVRRVVRHVR
ncbi:MAG: glycosyltransferase [Raoultibacter sp.]